MDTRESRAPQDPASPDAAPRRSVSASQCSDRAEFESRRRAAMPRRHAQRLANLLNSPEAMTRLANHPAFRDLFAGATLNPEFVPAAPREPMPAEWVLDRLHPRTLLSTLACGVCGEPVIYQHPLEPWQAARLPDESWARCHAHREAA